MRFRALHFEKFGHFSDRRLEFRTGARLHVIFGKNEAGKSTALAGVHNLLFGMPERTSYDFLHKSSDLRIGGEIETRDGRRLSFKRRKGRKRVLVDDSGSDLPDDILSQYMGGLTEEVFTRIFGLDADALRKGARELLASGGEVGESLMAAASGLRGLSGIRNELEAEADKIFAARKSNERAFYQILERYDTARKLSHELELGASKWKKLNEDIAERAEELGKIGVRRREIAIRTNRLSRLSSLKPVMGRIDAESAKLRTLNALPDLPRGFGAELIEALSRVTDAEGLAKMAEETVANAKRELAQISVNAALIARGKEIVELFSKTGGYINARRDLPVVRGQADEDLAKLTHVADKLGISDAKEIEAALPTASAQARIATLIKLGDALENDRVRILKDLAREQDSVQKLEDSNSLRGAVKDPGPLREKLDLFGDVAAQLERAKQASTALESDLRALSEEALRLSPPVHNLDELAIASLPGPSILARYRLDLEAAAAANKTARQQADACQREIDSLESKLEELARDRPVPSREFISAARADREASWAPVRAAAFSDIGAPAGAALASAVARFESAMLEADRLADDGARDAARVASWVSANAALAEKKGEALKLASALLQTGAHLQNLEMEWDAAWAGVQIKPLPPAEMAAWHSSVDALVQRRAKLAAQRGVIDQARADLSRHEAPLAELAKEAGLEPLQGLDVGLLWARISARIKLLADPWDAARGDARALLEAKARVEKIIRERDELTVRCGEWTAQWSAALEAVNLRRDASLDEVRTALEAWRETPALLSAQKDRRRRVDGMIRDIEAFDQASTEMVKALAPDLASLDAQSAIAAMHDRLNAARSAEALYQDALKRESVYIAALGQARTALTQVRDNLANIARKAPDGADIIELSSHLVQRDAHYTELEKLRTQLAEQAPDQSEEQLRLELAGYEADGATAESESLAEEGERLEAREKDIYSEKDRLERQRAEWEKGVGAEVATQQRRNAEAELRDAAREWAVLKIGTLLISRTLDYHRSSQRDPLLQRAGEFFALLTGGAYIGLGQDYDDDDRPRLTGIRASGEIVPIDELNKGRSPMSTGTLDQFFLALRLAYIEDYSSRAEPVPFIGDDLFTSFDDGRTGYGLEALAALSERTQIILFTHHRHVVDIAQARLGDGLDLININ